MPFVQENSGARDVPGKNELSWTISIYLRFQQDQANVSGTSFVSAFPATTLRASGSKGLKSSNVLPSAIQNLTRKCGRGVRAGTGGPPVDVRDLIVSVSGNGSSG